MKGQRWSRRPAGPAYTAVGTTARPLTILLVVKVGFLCAFGCRNRGSY